MKAEADGIPKRLRPGADRAKRGRRPVQCADTLSHFAFLRKERRRITHARRDDAEVNRRQVLDFTGSFNFIEP
jgi:hypothetical protein